MTDTRTRIVIQSRLSSSRLPGKALLTVAGMPLVELVARRAGRTGHEVVVATSAEPHDDRIAAHLDRVGIAVVRGSLDDVLGRFVVATADLAPADRVVRLTGDNPVGDGALVDELLAAMGESGHAYGRVDIDRVPEGIGAEAFSVADLRAAADHATAAYDREHVTPWLRRTLGELLFVPAGSPTDPRAHRATIDTLDDYVRVSAVFDAHPDPVAVPWPQLMQEVARRADEAGPRAPVRDGGTRARVVVSARRFAAGGDGAEPAELARRRRAQLEAAVARGVTHLDVGADDGHDSLPLVRAALEPVLVRRLAVVLRTAPVADAPDAALALEAGVERCFAELGRRGVDTLVLADAASARAAWPRALAYRDAGLVQRLGVVVTSADDARWAAAEPDVAWVELAGDPEHPEHPETARHLSTLLGRGVEVAVVTSALRDPVRTAAWATLVVADLEPAALDEAVRAARSAHESG